MSTLRQAAQQALEALVEINKLSIGERAICLPGEIDTAMDALRAALAEPEQEPVALPCCGYANASAVKWNPHNQVVQCHNCGQIYTAPTPRKPLTDEEIWKCLPPDPDELAFARAIERAHGIGEQHE